MSSDDEDDAGFGRGQRLDKWLWHARFARTRSAAARLVLDGHVRVNAKREETCARRVRDGDVLTISLGRGVRVVRLRSFAARRGSATDAQQLYETVDSPDSEPGDAAGRSPCAAGTKKLADPQN